MSDLSKAFMTAMLASTNTMSTMDRPAPVFQS